MISLEMILAVFWRNIDPTDANGQFCDRGSQYRTAIFVGDANEEKIARTSIVKMQEEFSLQIVTDVRPRCKFYPAEEMHQQYYRKNPARYYWYKKSCGRARRLNQLWAKA